MIIDEKTMLAPPPPYLRSPATPTTPVSLAPPPFIRSYPRPTFNSLPPHILLQVVYLTFPQAPRLDEGRLERQRKTLYWLSTGLRLVNRAFYIACMNVLRSTYLPFYSALIRPPYTSDPFPLLSPADQPSPSSFSSTPSPISTLQRETAVLDLFIALKVREDVWLDDSELHLERDESFKDLFDLSQPRSRLEDLVRMYGVREGAVSVAPEAGRPQRAVPFGQLAVSFSPRRVGLVRCVRGVKKTIVDVPRARDEKLEMAAKRIIKELKAALGLR
ncbi:hypothetical protein BD779DRAFT_665717 [Infundibulicybe gibba]|nr:hypothetical protein BD779DRAFT_665717 [Infundibulicybe gibba]